MRKLLVLPLFLAAFFAGFDVCAANARGGRSIAAATGATVTATDSATQTTQNATGNNNVAARVANRNRARTAPNAGTATTARVAKRTAVRAAAVPKTNANATVPATTGVVNGPRTAPNTTTGKANSAVSARAATKKSALNMGTKVKDANTTTVYPKECGDAFNGCVDALCMMDNASGGRCRCDDRIDDLDTALDLIMQANAAIELLRGEAMQRIKEGADLEAVESWVDDAIAKTNASDKKNSKDFLKDAQKKNNASSKKTYDFSSLNNVLFDTDSLFEMGEDSAFQISDLADKKGADLRNSAMKMCGPKLPDDCKQYGEILTATYSRQIANDCLGYLNSLKQQQIKAQSDERQARAELREAALNRYREENKYRTEQECAVPYAQCMQGDSVCGAGYKNCIGDNMVFEDVNSKKIDAQIKTKAHKIQTANVTVDINEATYMALEGQRGACESVLRQCVNVKDKVWDAFLKLAAADIKSSEFAAEEEARGNCVRDIVSCITEAAAGEGFEEGSDRWSFFTQDIKNFEETCSVQIRRCNANGSTQLSSKIREYVKMALDAKRVDQCTTKIRTCLENNCGEDFGRCLGVSMATLRGFCSTDEIAADCEGSDRFTELDDYINEVAQGLMYYVNDKLLTGCQNAVTSAMNTYCGGSDTCDNANIDFSDILQKDINYGLYQDTEVEGGKVTNFKNKSSISAFSEADATCPKWQAKMTWASKINQIVKNTADSGDTFIVNGDNPSNATKLAINKLNNAVTTVTNLIENDVNVKRCVDGATFENFDGTTLGQDNDSGSTGNSSSNNQASTTRDRSHNRSSITNYITPMKNNIKQTIANTVWDRFMAQYNARVAEVQTEIDSANETINQFYTDAGRVCPATESTAADNSSDETAAVCENNGTCSLGNCNCCDTAEKKCKCIAGTYFQAAHVKHHSHDLGEVTHLSSVRYDNSTCTIIFRRHKDCYLVADYNKSDPRQSWIANASDAWTGWDCVGHDDVRSVKFTLSDSTGISVGYDSSCQAKDDGWVSRLLKIGDTKICFNKCTSVIKQSLAPADHSSPAEVFIPWAGDGIWCGHDDFNKVSDNNLYVTDTNSKKDPISGDEIKHTNYKFYDNSNLK